MLKNYTKRCSNRQQMKRKKDTYFINLERVKYDQGNYPEAIQIQQRISPENDKNLATTYHNIASVYGNMGKYSEALPMSTLFFLFSRNYA